MLKLPWNDRAQARMRWSNVAHILETYTQHGGDHHFANFIQANRWGKAQALDALTSHARQIFGKMVIPGERGKNLQGDNHIMGEVVRGAAERIYRWVNSGANALRTFIKKPRNQVDPGEIYDPNNPAHQSRKGVMWIEDSHFREFRDHQTGDPASEAEFYKKIYEHPHMRDATFYRLAKLPGMRQKIER